MPLPTFISLDLETTGFNPFKDEIIEVAAVKFDYKKIHDQFTSLTNPGIPITLMISRLTGIKNSDLKNAPKFDAILPQFKEFIQDYPIIGHNISFDLNFLAAKGLDLPNFQLDTCDLARVLLPNLESYSLEILSKILKLPQLSKHRALDDCLVARDLFLHLSKTISEIPRPTLKTIQKVTSKSKWPLKDLFVSPPPRSRTQTTTDQKDQLSLFQTASPSQTTPTRSTTPKNSALSKTLSTKLQENSPALLECDQYSPEDWIKPTLEFAEKEKTQLLIVSPSPVMLRSEASRSMRSEASLPVSLHSPEQYLCQNQLEKFLNQDRFTNAEITLIIKLLLNLKNTQTGEKSEFSLFQEEYLAWLNVAAHEIACEKCSPEKCFFQKALQQTQKSPLIHISPHFFFHGPRKLIPPVKTVIFDQCQKLIDQKLYLFTQVHSLEKIQATLNHLPLESLSSRVEILFGLIGIFLEKHRAQDDFFPSVTLDDYRQKSAEWQKVHQTAQNIIQIEKEYLKTLPTDSPIHENLAPLLELMQNLTTPHHQILWITANQKQQILIKTIPQNLEEVIQEKINQITKNPLFIGPALSLENQDFTFTKEALGLPEDFLAETIPSPRTIKHTTKTPLHYITNLPDPATEQNFQTTVKILEKTIQKLKGQTFILCQNHKAMESFHLKLLPLFEPEKNTLLSQNISGGQGKIISHYLDKPTQSVVLGNLHLFQRLLETCPKKSLPTTLILHRLPFESFNHPYLNYKLKTLDNAFTAYTIPRAILKLNQILLEFLSAQPKPKQIILLDSRVETKEYGRSFLKSLPNNFQASSLKIAL